MQNTTIKILLKITLTLLVIGFLVGYIIYNWEQLQNLNRLQFQDLAGMYLLCLVQMALTSICIQRILHSLEVRIGFGEMFMLHNSTLLLNYVPMQFGTLFRAAYLKKRFGFSYTNFVAFFLYLTVMMLFCSVFAGEVILVSVYGLEQLSHKIIAIIFTLIILFCLIALFCPLPVPKHETRLTYWLNRFLMGRNQICRDRSTVMVCAVMLLISYVCVALRLWLLYHSLGQSVNPAGFFLLGSLGYIAIFVSLTPGGLGVRELILAGGAMILDIPFEIGAVAVLIDRAVLLSYAVVMGGISTTVLWPRAHLDKQTIMSTGKDKNL